MVYRYLPPDAISVHYDPFIPDVELIIRESQVERLRANILHDCIQLKKGTFHRVYAIYRFLDKDMLSIDTAGKFYKMIQRAVNIKFAPILTGMSSGMKKYLYRKILKNTSRPRNMRSLIAYLIESLCYTLNIELVEMLDDNYREREYTALLEYLGEESNYKFVDRGIRCYMDRYACFYIFRGSVMQVRTQLKLLRASPHMLYALDRHNLKLPDGTVCFEDALPQVIICEYRKWGTNTECRYCPCCLRQKTVHKLPSYVHISCGQEYVCNHNEMRCIPVKTPSDIRIHVYT